MRNGLAGKWAGLCGGVAVAVAATAFAAAAALAADPVTINVWSDTPRLPAFAAYQKAHPDVKLKVTTIAPDPTCVAVWSERGVERGAPLLQELVM